MSLTGKDVAEIARLLGESQFNSLDLKLGDFKLRIRRDGGGGGGDRWVEDEEEGFSKSAEASAPAEAGAQDEAALDSRVRGKSHSSAGAGPGAGEVDVPAPLLGNYYSAPRPGEDPFVAVGDRVEPDTVIAIIEVMKLMNSVRAGVAGTVTAVLPENGSAIEKGDAIIRVKVD